MQVHLAKAKALENSNKVAAFTGRQTMLKTNLKCQRSHDSTRAYETLLAGAQLIESVFGAVATCWQVRPLTQSSNHPSLCTKQHFHQHRPVLYDFVHFFFCLFLIPMLHKTLGWGLNLSLQHSPGLTSWNPVTWPFELAFRHALIREKTEETRNSSKTVPLVLLILKIYGLSGSENFQCSVCEASRVMLKRQTYYTHCRWNVEESNPLSNPTTLLTFFLKKSRSKNPRRFIMGWIWLSGMKRHSVQQTAETMSSWWDK